MGKRVLVTVRGYQKDGVEEGAVELVAAGDISYRNGKYYLCYEEVDEEESGENGLTKTRLKIEEDGGCVELVKKGLINTTMVFKPNGSTTSFYDSPYGKMLMEINTSDLLFSYNDGKMEIKMSYILNMNHQPISENTIHITAAHVV